MPTVILRALLILFSCGLFVPAAHLQEPNSTSDPNVLARFRIEKDAKPILLPVKFREKEYLFELDTGCSHTLFDISLRDKLGKPTTAVKAETATGRVKGELFHAPDAFLGPLNLKDCRKVAVLDLRLLGLSPGKKRYGIIGMDFLKRYIVQINFDKAVVSFLKPAADGGLFSFLQPRKDRHPDWGQQVPIKYRFLSRLPYIQGNVDGSKVTFLVDTGYRAYVDSPGHPFSDTTGELESKIFKKLRSRIQFETKRVTRIPGKGSVPSQFSKSAVIGRFSIGSLRYKDVVFDEAEESKLGLGFLSRHLVTFDFPNRKMYLKKGRYFDRPTGYYISFTKPNFDIRRRQDDIFVSSVDPNGLAYSKGIRQNDIILKVDDQDVTSCALVELVEFFSQLDEKEKKAVTFTIKHGDVIKQICFRRDDTSSESNGTD